MTPFDLFLESSGDNRLRIRVLPLVVLFSVTLIPAAAALRRYRDVAILEREVLNLERAIAEVAETAERPVADWLVDERPAAVVTAVTQLPTRAPDPLPEVHGAANRPTGPAEQDRPARPNPSSEPVTVWAPTLPRLNSWIECDGVIRVLIEFIDGVEAWLGEGESYRGCRVVHADDFSVILQHTESLRSVRFSLVGES